MRRPFRALQKLQSLFSPSNACDSKPPPASRIIEHRIPKIFDSRAHGKHRADVNNLRAIPNNVDTQQFQCVKIKQNQQSLIVAEHLPFRQFKVTRQPAFVRSSTARQLFLSESAVRHFRNSVDPAKESDSATSSQSLPNM